MGSDNNEKLTQEDETRELFPDFGFVPDTSSISGELTAANNVISQYRAILESGSAANLKETYDDYCAAMEAAGVQKIIDTYQEQLDAYRAAKEQKEHEPLSQKHQSLGPGCFPRHQLVIDQD